MNHTIYNKLDLLIPVFALETETEPVLELDLDEEQLAEAEKERKLVCAQCGKFITYSDEAIKIAGAHEHVCTNPHGMQFTIGCFRSAQGCIHVGDETERYTWFAGHSWCVANCAGCGVHLGWRFTNESRQFHGLILSRIIHPSP